VKCPVLLLHGEVDHNVPATDAKQLQAALVLRFTNNSRVG
jgi:dipeptidyl aminopeptidase/acylaminoacyl peptidase